MEHSFNLFNQLASSGIALTIDRLLLGRKPIILCIGSDLAIGDSLGPICGTLLHRHKNADLFVYGTLKTTVTAKEVGYMDTFLKQTHPHEPVIAIDAAVGEADDIGLIKIDDRGIYPGAGANKKLPPIGDIGIMGIVAEKSLFNYSLLNLTRLNLVYQMADVIASAILTYTRRRSNVAI